MSDPLHLCFTMDCELIAEQSPQGGPADWALSEQAIAGYAAALEESDLRAVFFAIPAVAGQHRDLFSDLRRRGHEIGMHCHPQNADLGYDQFLGEMSRARQRECLARCQDTFAAAMGGPAQSFRPGNFSASDDTFGVLLELGIDRGSVSLPGRHLQRFHAVWPQAELFAHWAQLADRQASGDSRFFEVPVTGDLERPGHSGRDDYDVPHLRFERGDLAERLEPIVEMNLRAQVEQNTAPQTLCFMTHNTRDYRDAAEPARANLLRGCEVAFALASRLSLTAKGATLSQVRDAALARRDTL